MSFDWAAFFASLTLDQILAIFIVGAFVGSLLERWAYFPAHVLYFFIFASMTFSLTRTILAITEDTIVWEQRASTMVLLWIFCVGMWAGDQIVGRVVGHRIVGYDAGKSDGGEEDGSTP